MSKIGDKILSTFGFEVVYTDPSEETAKEPAHEAPAAKPATSKIESSAKDTTSSPVAADPFNEVSSHIVLFELDNIREAKGIVDELKVDRTVVINVEKLEENDTQRLFDFITGACYALRGTVKEIDRYVFVIAPHNVSVRRTEKAEPEASDAGEGQYEEGYEY